MIKPVIKKCIVIYLLNIATRQYQVEVLSECVCEWDYRHRVIVRDHLH